MKGIIREMKSSEFIVHFFFELEDIKNHKMSWDNLALRESNGLHFAPSSSCGIGLGGPSSTKNISLKNMNFTSSNRITPI